MAAPIAAISVKGDAYAVGHGIGAAVAPHVRDAVLRHDEFRLLQDRWAGSDRVAALRAAAERIFPSYLRELEGMADGAGVAPETLFLWNCRGDLRLPADADAGLVARAAEGCTTVMVPPGDGFATPAVIAHNEDGAADFDGRCLWIDVAGDDGVPFRSFLYPGMLPGHSFAVNGAGLVQTINNIRAHDLQPGLPRHFVTRAVLDCRSLDDALAVLARRDRASGFHHALAQRGDSRVLSVEAPASGIEVRRVTRPSVHANHLLADGFAGLAQTVTESSAYRQQRGSALVADGAAPESVLFHRDAATGGAIHCRPGDGGADYGCTLAPAVFEIGEAEVAWRVHRDARRRDVHCGRAPGV